MSASAGAPPGSGGNAALTERVDRLEAQVAALTEAVGVLARGLERSPVAEPPSRQVEDAARQAHELLLFASSPAGRAGGSAAGG